ncbi:hypothetical protein HPB50_017844 [Hyalomma asiaticum]|uniref:Uncharacterized protein n=1 Tax=Hyalomma asiaticum TaxID=266040 RepID=A0ACB7TM94_HYAAI|nr:hypothetical protein HPB50_017844 [Hyalomma asiaticum]
MPILPPAEPASHTAPRGPPALLDDDEDKDNFIHELLSLLSIFFDFIPLDHPMRESYLEMFNTVYFNQPSD